MANENVMAQALAAGQAFAAQHGLAPAGPNGWLDPASPNYQAALAFASGVLGLQKADETLRKLSYLSEWKDRFAGVTDFLVYYLKRDGAPMVLQGLRSAAVQHAGKWCFPGGTTHDSGYTTADALTLYRHGAAELADETGLVLTPEELATMPVLVNQFQSDYHLEKNKRFLHTVFAVSLNDITSIKANTCEMERLAFVPAHALLTGDPNYPQAFPDIQEVWFKAFAARLGWV